MRKSFALLIIPIFLIIIYFYSNKSKRENAPNIETCIDIQSQSIDLQYYCTAADSKYYEQLLNLIASIHRFNFDKLGHVAVFDLGLNAFQLKALSQIKKVRVYQIESLNPHILTQFEVNKHGKMVPGWYSWKLVAIKQAYDLFPEDSVFLWIDAGTTLLKDISPLFEYIKNQGYFFHNGWQRSIKEHITKFVVNSLNLNSFDLHWLLGNETYCVESGVMGFSQDIYDSIIMPAYHLAKDIRYFIDDGSAEGGFGAARPDQIIYSLYVRKNKLFVFEHYAKPFSPFILEYGNQKISFHIASLNCLVTEKTQIVCSRKNSDCYFRRNRTYLKYN